jgi:hypothetical protein
MRKQANLYNPSKHSLRSVSFSPGLNSLNSPIEIGCVNRSLLPWTYRRHKMSIPRLWTPRGCSYPVIRCLKVHPERHAKRSSLETVPESAFTSSFDQPCIFQFFRVGRHRLIADLMLGREIATADLTSASEICFRIRVRRGSARARDTPSVGKRVGDATFLVANEPSLRSMLLRW